MGNFFTSIQIHNPEGLSKEQFIELFCNKMKEKGFVIGNTDDNEISYALSFSDNRKWISIGSESYEQGNAAVQKDTVNIAKMLNTCCINVTVVDSDFAMLDMYSNAGKKLDTAIMGRADDYLGDDIPAPKKNIWSELISKNSTWERFTEVQQGDYVFVEDGLAELAPFLGMDGKNILFDYKDTNEADENICFLYFKKASTQKAKKLTLNAAFKQIFGQALEPLGFVKLKKTKLPIYVRIVNGEIIHIVTYRNKSAMKKGYKRFEVLGGVISIYRRTIDFDETIETSLYNNFNYYNKYDVSVSTELMQRIVQFNCDIWEKPIEWYHESKEMKDEFIKQIIDFQCRTDDPDEMLKGIKNAFDVTNEIMLPLLNKIIDLTTCINFFYKNNSHALNLCEIKEFIKNDNFSCSESLLLILANYRDNGKERTKIDIKKHLSTLIEEITPELTKQISLLHESKRLEQVAIRDRILDTPELKKFAMDEAERCKTKNIEMLKTYGLNLGLKGSNK